MMAKILLIGGCGFVGKNLTTKLLQYGHKISLIDTVLCPEEFVSKDEVTYFRGDATEKEFLVDIMTKMEPQIVIIIASWGMSGENMLDKKCFEINVSLAIQTVNACVECSVSKLIYTSSYNVVYGGIPIVNGDESTPYYPVDKHTDCYSASKYMAEDYILKANKTKLRKGGNLTTCCLRPAAIYGEGEQRHFPRIITHLDHGLFLFRIGNAIVDWVHVDNLTLAYIATINKLLADRHVDRSHPILGGQAYFISDDSPISNFEFLKPLCIIKGIQYPSLIIPTSLMVYVAYGMEQLYFFSKKFKIYLPPFFTQAEIFKVGYTHYFSIQKAKRDLGYQPIFNSLEGSRRIAQYYSKQLSNTDYFEFAHIMMFIGVFLPLTMLFITGYNLQSILIWEPLHTLCQLVDTCLLFIIPYRVGHMCLFWGAHIIHLIEAIYTYQLAMKLGFNHTKYYWCIQSLFIGYGSIRLLLLRDAFVKKKTKMIK